MCFFIELLVLIHRKRVTNGERKLLGPVHTNAFSFENASTEDKALELYSLLNEYNLACKTAVSPRSSPLRRFFSQANTFQCV